MRVPDRGDLIVLDFEPQAGYEQMKRRPALVLSPGGFNSAFGLAFVAPVTTKARGHAFEVVLPAQMRIKGVVMMQQVKSLDWRARNAKFAGRVPPAVLATAIDVVRLILEGEA